MRRDSSDFPDDTFPISRQNRLLPTPNAVFLHRREPNQGDWVQVGNSLTFLAVNLQRPKLSVQPTVLRKLEQMSAEPGGIIPLQIWMGRKADMKAFSTDTYHFHAQQCSTYWDPHATGEQLEQTVVLGKWDITALTALFAFAVLLNPSPTGLFFFFPVCQREQKEQHLLSAAFLHQAFLSVSPGKILQPPTGLKTGGTDLKMLPRAVLGQSLLCTG